MRIRVLAVGTRMPAWVAEGVKEYQKRCPKEWQLSWCEIPVAKRQGASADQLMALEAQSIRRQLKASEQIVALDVRGALVSTEDLAAHITDWQMTGQDTALVIGGPEGIAPELLREAHYRWSLGKITLPHPLVRVLLTEQLYRAWSINAQHPYHRG